MDPFVVYIISGQKTRKYSPHPSVFQEEKMATTDKYDRQLRLWGASGQRALGETCVVLLRATAAGTETCKNLVLPGIGALYIVDDHAVIGDQYMSNFFLTKTDADAGKGRAQNALENLLELNPDVQGSYLHVSEGLHSLDLAALLVAIPTTAFAGGGTTIRRCIVIGSDLEPTLLRTVAAVCDDRRTPFIAVHSYGLIGLVRLQTPPLALLDPKPRDTVPDLRLLRPFPSLQTLADTIDWDHLPDHEHGHVPYPYILLRAMTVWQTDHATINIPKTMVEKQEFVATVKSMARNYDMQLNFHEAVNNAYLAYTERVIDWDRLDHIAASLPPDHVVLLLISALREFCQQHRPDGPLHGSIPDMTASTEHYVKLQGAYRQQADADRDVLKSFLLKAAEVVVDDETMVLFCQNVHDLDVFQCRSIHDEWSVPPDGDLCDDLAMVTIEGDERPDQLALLWYLSWRACQDFVLDHQRYPGTGSVTDYRPDIPLVQSYLEQVVHWYKLETNELVQSTLLDTTKNMAYAEEMVRYGAAELHTIASIVGGVAAQEAVKIVTGQYTPLHYLYVYNGIASTAGVYKV
jgi:NEDD8-activating enzyme E1 regulatory subunit